MTLQFRAEAFNLTNTPHFANPSGTANVSNLQLNADGTIRNLGGFSSITTTANTGRDGIDERLFRVGVRFGFSDLRLSCQRSWRPDCLPTARLRHLTTAARRFA